MAYWMLLAIGKCVTAELPTLYLVIYACIGLANSRGVYHTLLIKRFVNASKEKRRFWQRRARATSCVSLYTEPSHVDLMSRVAVCRVVHRKRELHAHAAYAS